MRILIPKYCDFIYFGIDTYYAINKRKIFAVKYILKHNSTVIC